MRVAIIDLGTNTCNLLVAEILNENYRILHQSKQLVRLGDNKIKDNEISEEATERAVESFREHKKIITHFHVDRVRVFATSAVRDAANKIPFLERLGEESGWLVKVISGDKEAELIFKGVLLAFHELENPAMILDIGGGSNELILAHKKELLWKESRPTGMARVINNFELSDPIQKEEVESLQKYFADQHKNAVEACKKEAAKMLVGCSGAFDTIVDIIDEVEPGIKQRTTQEIAISDFYRVHEMLLKSTREERLQMKGMDYVRIDLIVPAVILIETLVREIGITRIVQTDFALREGVVFELMKKISKSF